MPGILRLATLDDAEDILAIYAPVVADSFVSFEASVPSLDEVRRRIATTIATHPWLVCEHEGRVVAYAYSGTHRPRAGYRWTVEVSVYVADAARRHGIGRRLYVALFAMLRALGHRTAVAGIALPNPASVALHVSLGFTAVGVFHGIGFKHGAWRDVSWWELPLADYTTPPAEPMPLPELLRDGERVSELLADPAA